MNELHFPWLELAVLIPLVSAALISRVRDPELGRKWFLAIAGLTLACTLCAWADRVWPGKPPAHGPSAFPWPFDLQSLFVIDELSTPLTPLTALLFVLTAIGTLRTKVRRFSFVRTLTSLALVLATLCCREPWGIIGLLAAATVPPFLELLARRKPTRVYVLHMGLFIGLLVLGWIIVELEGRRQAHTLWAVVPLFVAVLIRSGIFPFHCWVSDLFEHLAFGSALLVVTPLAGAYAAARLLIPLASDDFLRGFGLLSAATAVYASAMTLVQTDARRLFAFLCVSHGALVLVGLQTVSQIGLTGGLCVWISVSFSLAGLGLTLRLLEARHGRLSLTRFHGLYEHTPLLAVCFLLTGLASVGFPGMLGFVGGELLIDGAVQAYPQVGVAVILASALNGIAVVKTYFRLFTGTRHMATVPLAITGRERLVVSIVAGVILIGGLFPQLQVQLCHQAAQSLLSHRKYAADDGRTTHKVPSTIPQQPAKH